MLEDKLILAASKFNNKFIIYDGRLKPLTRVQNVCKYLKERALYKLLGLETVSDKKLIWFCYL